MLNHPLSRRSSWLPGSASAAPPTRPSVYLKREERKLRRTFPTLAAAKAWRAEALTAADRGALRGPSPTTVREAWEAWHAGAKAGTIRNRSGNRYKPSALRAYERTMRLRVLPEFGPTEALDLGLRDLQDLVERLLADRLSPSTVQVTLLPLRAIYKRAVARGELTVNPTTGLAMPAVTERPRALRGPERGRGADRVRFR